jgi:LuxR family quorum sensing-dependent transcriptional regulator
VPSLWRDCPGAKASRVIAEARDFGLNDGFAIPYLMLSGDVAGISLGGARVEMGEHGATILPVVACFALGRILQIRTRTTAHAAVVSPRERECLAWIAAGKTDWEISSILTIAEATVDKHVRRARAKLGAANRAQAVAEALRCGIIS